MSILRQCLRFGTARHQGIEALPQHLFLVIPGEREKTIIRENYSVGRSFCVRKYHWHPRRLSGDDERAKVFSKAVDLGLGGFLLLGSVYDFRHTGLSREW
jgi:hypothetical protein